MRIDGATLVPAVTFLLYILYTVFGITQRHTERVRRSFLLYMGALSIWSFGSFAMHADSGILTPLFWNRVMMVGLLAVPITCYHALLSLMQSKQRHRHVMLILGYAVYLFLLFLNFRGAIVSDAGFTESSFYYRLGPRAVVAYTLSYAFLIYAVIIVGRELNKATDTVDKKRLRPLLVGAVFLLAGVLGNIDETIGRYPVDLFAAGINGLLIFYSIYKYRLVHYSRIVLTVIVYFILIVIAAFVFTGILQLASAPFKNLEFRRQYLLSLVVAAVSAFIFQPLREGAVWIIRRIYFGKRFTYQESLKAFSSTLVSIINFNELVSTIVDKIQTTFRVEWVAFFVLDYSSLTYRIASQKGLDLDGEAEKSISIPRDSSFFSLDSPEDTYRTTNRMEHILALPDNRELSLDTNLLVPLRFHDRINGWILFGRSTDKEFLDQLDLETIEIFAAQCSIALENAITFERLRQNQHRLQILNQELLISKNKLEAFFDGITAPISLQDVNYNIVLANVAAARFFGRPVEKIVGNKCYSVYFDRSLPCPGCMAQDCLHTQLPFSTELTHDTSGTSFALQFYPISVPEGTTKLFLEFFHDVTEQKRLRAELLQSAKLAGIGTLASGIAHEINNPLSAIISTAEIIRDESGSESEIHEMAEEILSGARDAASIISDLNTYARKDSTTQTEVDLQATIENAVKMAHRGLNTDLITTRISCEPHQYVQGNQNEVRQVFLNLIVNAIQAMPNGGELEITARREEEQSRVTIRDTGSGIPPELRNRIFEPFFTTKNPGEGTGLGLSISNQIIYRIGGRLSVTNSDGNGTTMEVLIPSSMAEAPTIRFVQARTPRDIDDVFFVQRKILVGEKGYREETIQRPEDNNAFHVLAYKGLQPVGTVSCIVDTSMGNLPITKYLPDKSDVIDVACAAEIDRLAVVKEERGGFAAIGLMMLAYMHARAYGAERVFLDVFSDDKAQNRMYHKLGFTEVLRYHDPLEVTVMILNDKLNYETDANRLNRFLKPMILRLFLRIDFDPAEKAMIEEQKTKIFESTSED